MLRQRTQDLCRWGEHVGNHQPSTDWYLCGKKNPTKPDTELSESNRPNNPQCSQGLEMALGPMSQGEQPSSMNDSRWLTLKALPIASIWNSCSLKATLKIPYKLQIFRGPNGSSHARIESKLKPGNWYRCMNNSFRCFKRHNLPKLIGETGYLNTPLSSYRSKENLTKKMPSADAIPPTIINV